MSIEGQPSGAVEVEQGPLFTKGININIAYPILDKKLNLVGEATVLSASPPTNVEPNTKFLVRIQNKTKFQEFLFKTNRYSELERLIRVELSNLNEK